MYCLLFQTVHKPKTKSLESCYIPESLKPGESQGFWKLSEDTSLTTKGMMMMMMVSEATQKQRSAVIGPTQCLWSLNFSPWWTARMWQETLLFSLALPQCGPATKQSGESMLEMFLKLSAPIALWHRCTTSVQSSNPNSRTFHDPAPPSLSPTFLPVIPTLSYHN